MTSPDSESKSTASDPPEAPDRQTAPHPLAATHPLAAHLPSPALQVIERLERRGIACWVQGDGLLRALGAETRAERSAAAQPTGTPIRMPTTLLCEARAESLLSLLPTTVATAAGNRRLSLGIAGCSIDLLPLGTRPVQACLTDFGLSAHAFAWRPTRDEWADPLGGRALFQENRLDTASDDGPGSIFRAAPQRFWIVGRLLAEHALVPTDRLVDLARNEIARCLATLPRAAVARREIERVLASSRPEAGLTFWNKIGLTSALFPGLRASNAKRVGALRAVPALRFAVWLDGASPGRSLRLLRMPHERAAKIERLLRHHPIEASPALAGGVQARVLRLRKRLDAEEVDSLIEWRRLELERAGADAASESARARLADLEAGLAQAQDQREAQAQIRALAMDGAGVMEILACGPGRHVGAALKHLSELVARDPDSNEPARLADALRVWFASQPENDESE